MTTAGAVSLAAGARGDWQALGLRVVSWNPASLLAARRALRRLRLREMHDIDRQKEMLRMTFFPSLAHLPSEIKRSVAPPQQVIAAEVLVARQEAVKRRGHRAGNLLRSRAAEKEDERRSRQHEGHSFGLRMAVIVKTGDRWSSWMAPSIRAPLICFVKPVWKSPWNGVAKCLEAYLVFVLIFDE